MYDTTIAAKLLRLLESFLGRISPHFHKPVARFIGDMIYGIMVEKREIAKMFRFLKNLLYLFFLSDRFRFRSNL